MSSTYSDLVQFRCSAISYLNDSTQFVEAMEYWVAEDSRPLDKCLEEVRRSDLVVLLVGFRYGSTNKDGMSFTECEYEEAVEHDIPVLPFLLSESRWATELIADSDDPGRIKKFRQKLLDGHVCIDFDSIEEFGSVFQRSMDKYLWENDLVCRRRLEEYQRNAIRAWENCAPSDVRVNFDFDLDVFEILNEIESNLDHMDRLTESLRESSERLNDDVRICLRDLGLDVSIWDSNHYIENPCINRDWERLNMGVVNVLHKLRLLTLYTRLRSAEQLDQREIAFSKKSELVESARFQFLNAISRAVAVD